MKFMNFLLYYIPLVGNVLQMALGLGQKGKRGIKIKLGQVFNPSNPKKSYQSNP